MAGLHFRRDSRNILKKSAKREEEKKNRNCNKMEQLQRKECKKGGMYMHLRKKILSVVAGRCMIGGELLTGIGSFTLR